MNVLYVCADRGIPVLGGKGASVHVRLLTSAIERLGHRVTLVARRWDDGNESPALARLEHLAKESDDAADQLEQLIVSERVDVVIERYSLQSGPAREATRRCGLPLTFELNAPLAEEAIRFRGLEEPDAVGRQHRALADADRIHVVSPALGRYVRDAAPAVPVAVIPNGVDVARFHAAPVAELPGADGRTVVGFAGSMKPWHGVEQLLEAFASVRPDHPEAVLALIGSGPLEAALVARAAEPDLDGSVILTGQVSHAQVPSLLARIDVGVAPYLPIEGFYFHPLKVVEYLASGKPVIYADQGDLNLLVGDAGFGYAPGSVGGLAARLGQLLGAPALRSELAERAAARGAGFDWSVIAGRVLRFASGEDAPGPGAPQAEAIVSSGGSR